MTTACAAPPCPPPEAQLQALLRAVDTSRHDTVDARLRELEATLPANAALVACAQAAASHSLYRRNRLTEAAQCAASAMELARASQDAAAIASSQVAWARIEWAAGRLDEALTHLEEAGLQPVHDDRLQLHLNNLLGLVHADLGRAAESEAFHRAALAAARRSGLPDLQMIALTNLAGRLLVRGLSAAPPEASAAWHELDALMADAQALALAHQQELALPHILVTHAASLIERGRLDDALGVLQRQQAIMDRYPDRSSLPHAAEQRARLHRLQGQTDAARAALVEGIDGAASLGAKARQAALHLAASELEEHEGRFPEALHHHKRFHALREECALESAQRKATALAVRLQTDQALRDAADQRRRAQELAQRNDQLREQAVALSAAAFIDALTGLANRRQLETQWPALYGAARLSGAPLCVVMADVDHFKRINDRFSHAVGDRVLQTLGEIFGSHFRRGDMCARYGGEEFVIVLPDVDTDVGRHICERLRQRVELHDWSAIHPELKVTISQGMCEGLAQPDAAAALACADQQLYEAKRLGRNRLVVLA